MGSTKHSVRIGFVGTGNMGRPMVLNLLKAGYHVTIFDIRKEAGIGLLEAGALWGDSPKAVALKSEYIFISLPGPPEVEDAILGKQGVLAGTTKGNIIVDLSTNYPVAIKRIAEIASQKGVCVLDAPVTGGTFGAETGNLTIMVGGDSEAYKRALNILKVLGKQISLVGPIGSGTSVKLINNLLAEIQIFGIAEAMALAAKLGLDLNKLYEVLSNSFISSGILTQKYARCGFKGNFEPAFSIDLAYKDQGLVMDLAREEGIPLYLGTVIFQKLIEARAKGLGNKDITAILLPIEELFKIKIRITENDVSTGVKR